MDKLTIAEKLVVGFQTRNDTYSQKLAYVTYIDAKGVHRKATSWESWRDKSIDAEYYDNEPVEGFVINKKVGDDYGSGWNHRKAHIRVFDPRGFEFEISPENLLYILQYCNCIKGKGIEGKCVYAWDGPELVLMPIESSDYTESVKHTANTVKPVSKKDLVVGKLYSNKGGDTTYLYLGRFDSMKLNKSKGHLFREMRTVESYYYSCTLRLHSVDTTVYNAPQSEIDFNTILNETLESLVFHSTIDSMEVICNDKLTELQDSWYEYKSYGSLKHIKFTLENNQVIQTTRYPSDRYKTQTRKLDLVYFNNKDYRESFATLKIVVNSIPYYYEISTY